MSEITFYRQLRQDGAARTGIEVDGETAYSAFDSTAVEPDPSLVWYVDVRCTSPALPAERVAARDWLLGHSQEIGGVLNKAADAIPAGVDPAGYPLQVTERVNGAEVTVATSAVRRVEARDLAQILRHVAGHFREQVESLNAINY